VVVVAMAWWLASAMRGRGAVYLPVCIKFKLSYYRGLILNLLGLPNKNVLRGSGMCEA
jgi:hypothetical protein